MPELTACPTLPLILQLLRTEAAIEQVDALVRHLATCPVCTVSLSHLNISESVIEHLRAIQAAGAADPERIDSLIIALRAAPPFASPTDQTLAGSHSTAPAGEDYWTSLLTPPLGPDELGRLGGYRVLRVLGSGGMGVIFEAEDPDLNRRVALKVPHRALMKNPAARERFLREARAAAALKDEHIVTIYQVSQATDLPFLVMELLTGEPLNARLKRDRGLPLAEVLRIGRETAVGLAVAHDQGLIHRDIKPANIWLTTVASPRDSHGVSSTRVKLLDFGLAGPAATDTHLTALGHTIGTPHYLAPEQARGDSVDHRADLFSLGCVLYELAGGSKAFSGNSVMSVLTAMATATPRPLPEIRSDLPPALCVLIDRLLNKDPAQRPATAWEVVESFQSIEQGLTIPSVTAVPPPAAGPPIRVGILHSLTGTLATSERPVIDATLLAIEEINNNGGLLGSPVEAVIEDGQSDGAVFAAKSQKLITEDKVAAVFGCWTSASRKAVRPVFEKHDHLLVYPVQYEGLEQSPNILYVGAAPNQQIIPAVTWCCTFLKKQRLFLVGSDYVFPRVANTIMRDQAVSLGAEIVGEEYLLLGSMDVQAVVQKIAASQAEVILNTINGDTNLAFFRALRAAGITSANLPTISFSIPEEDLSSFTPKDVAGDYAAWNYFQSIDRSQNHAFLNRFHKRFGTTRIVSDPMEAVYVGVHLWAQAVRQAQAIDPPAVRQALKTQTYDAPEGMVRIDSETQHTEKFVRMGQITAEGRFAVVYCSQQAITPVPYPQTRPRAEWDALLNDLQLRWGGNWANPGR